MPFTLPRATFFFQSANGSGWSETWYAQNASNSGILQQKCLRYSRERLKTLSDNCWISYVRYGDAAVKRSYQILQNAVGEFLGQAVDSSNSQNDAVNVRVDTGPILLPVHRRSWLVRGIPDDVVNDTEFGSTGGVNPASPWSNNMANFIGKVLFQDWGIRYVANPVGPVYAIAPVDNTSFIIRRSCSRRTGRPFGQLAGRRLTT